MKRSITVFLLTAFLVATLFTFNTTVYAETDSGKNSIVLQIGNAYMEVNGSSQEIDPGKATTPILYFGRTVLPIRAVVEAMGGTVGWNGNEKKVTITARGSTVEMWIDSITIRVNGSQKKIDVAPAIINGRTMVPVRFVTENLNCTVDWDGVTKKVTIKYSLENHEKDLRQFFSFITKGDPIWSVRQLAYKASPNEVTAQQWLANFQSLKSLKVVSVEQASPEQWTDKWESYKVALDVTTSEPPEKYGWENGRNIRWVTLIPQGGGAWKVEALATSP
jgi:hypothetical protein